MKGGWEVGRLLNAIYKSTKPGWFDSFSFKHWFVDLILLAVTNKDGPIFVFGDNLSPHFCEESVCLAKEHNVYFIMLPANVTSWLQILGMAVFGPMKRMWMNILKKWRMESKRVGKSQRRFFHLSCEGSTQRSEKQLATILCLGFWVVAFGLWTMMQLWRNFQREQLKHCDAEETNISLNETLIKLLKENCGCSNQQKLEGRKEGLEECSLIKQHYG